MPCQLSRTLAGMLGIGAADKHMPSLVTHACRQNNAFAAHCCDKHTAVLQAACPLPTAITSLTRHQTAYTTPAGNPATLNPRHTIQPIPRCSATGAAPSHVPKPLPPPCILMACAAATPNLGIQGARPGYNATASQLQSTLKGALSTATTRTQQATQQRWDSSSMHAASNCHCCKMAAHAQSYKTETHTFLDTSSTALP
jgi:hypothetical protein